MTDLERIEMEIDGREYDLTLPGNGRFRIINDGIEFCEPDYPGIRAKRWHRLISATGSRCFSSNWFPDACTIAAGWHQDQEEKQYDDTGFQANKYRAAAAVWRAAKRAYLALKEANNDK